MCICVCMSIYIYIYIRKNPIFGSINKLPGHKGTVKGCRLCPEEK